MSWWLSIIACTTVEASAPAGPGWWFPPPMGLVPIRAEPPSIAAFAEPEGTVNLLVRFSTEDPIARWKMAFSSEPVLTQRSSAGVHPEGLEREKASPSHRVTLTGSAPLEQPLRIEGAILPVPGGAYVFEAVGPPETFGWVDNALDTLLTTAGPPLSPEAWATACSDPCMGLRSVEIWRAADRSIGRVHTRGDLSKCSHVMSTWRDAEGAELLSVSDKPVAAARATEIRRQIDAIVADHTLAGTLDCPPPG